MIQSNHDSNAIRASVLDAYLQLGALDSNNPIRDWIFNPASSSEQTDEGNPHGSRFHERISPSLRLEDTGVVQVEERRTPFSVVRFKSVSKIKSNVNPDSRPNDGHSARRETGFLSVRSFFRRSSASRRSENQYHDGGVGAYADHDGGPASTNSRSLFQAKHHSGMEQLNPASVHDNSSSMPRAPFSATSSYGLSPLATPIVQSLHDGGGDDDDGGNRSDDDWEEIELRPQSLLYALQHENNPPPAKRLKKKRRRVSADQLTITENVTPGKPLGSFSFPFPRLNLTPKSRKSTAQPPLVYPPSCTQPHRLYPHSRSVSLSTPSSPIVILTPPDTPRPTPSIISVESRYKPQLTHRPSMGYHNQFFVRGSSQPATPKLAMSLPPSSPSHRNRRASSPPIPSHVRHTTTPPL